MILPHVVYPEKNGVGCDPKLEAEGRRRGLLLLCFLTARASGDLLSGPIEERKIDSVYYVTVYLVLTFLIAC